MSLIKKEEDNNYQKEKNKKKGKTKLRKQKSAMDLFPPLLQKPIAPKINILIDNKYIFPKVGLLGKESKPCYVGHTKPITRIIYLNKNIFCSISQDSVNIKMWDLNNYNAQCLKNIDVKFITSDLLTVNENNIIVSGEKLIILNIEKEEQTIIFQPKLGNYIEFNLLAKINDNLGATYSLGGYFLLFELNTGKKLKKIEMNKIHFLCDLENRGRQEKIIEDPNIKIINKDIGSSKCLPTEKGHRGQVYVMIGLNSKFHKDCIISGGFDNVVKIFKTKENEVINLIGHKNSIIALTLSESKNYVFSSSIDYCIRKWNLSNCTCENIMDFNQGIQSILLPMSNDFLLSAGYDGRIKIWNNNALNVKNYYYQHGSITTGTLLPGHKDLEKNMFIFGDHLGEIFIKQFIVGDEIIKNFNKLKKKYVKKNTECIRLSSKLGSGKNKNRSVSRRATKVIEENEGNGNNGYNRNGNNSNTKKDI